MRLLFITQKLHGQDSFGVLWVREFIRQGFEVEVICLDGPPQPFEFPVHSLGKEHGASKASSMLRFERLIASLQYDRVFIHMSPVWYALGGWWWLLRGIPAYLWYTHYKMQLGVRLFGWFGRRFFCATPQSLPQYEGGKKKIVVGHGIDLAFWPRRRNISNNSSRLLVVHRLSRSKRVELLIHSLTHLDPKFTIDIYGIEAEPDYCAFLKTLVFDLKLQSRVTFHGTVPMKELPEIYVRHRLILNMASETIDKTMLEAMTCGCYPVTTSANASAVGLIPLTPGPSPEGRGENVKVFAPVSDSPESIADFIRTYADKAPIDEQEMYRIVEEGHSLKGLVAKMGKYVRDGR